VKMEALWLQHPGDIGRETIRDHDLPLQGGDHHPPRRAVPRGLPAVIDLPEPMHISPRIEGVMEHPVEGRAAGPPPLQLAPIAAATRRTPIRTSCRTRRRSRPATLPNSSNVSKISRTTDWTCSSGSMTNPPEGERTYPIGGW
jgi:hypothetical protein